MFSAAAHLPAGASRPPSGQMVETGAKTEWGGHDAEEIVPKRTVWHAQEAAVWSGD
jgi:hypothetical protein